MKYLCVKKCFWNNTLYEKGETVDLNEKVKVPEHFKPLGNTCPDGHPLYERGQGGEEELTPQPQQEGQGMVKKAKVCVKDKK